MAKLTYKSWAETSEVFPIDDESKGALNVLRWAYGEYDDELVYACSFGVEGIVMIDLISQIKPTAKVVFLETGFHFQETHTLIDEVKKRYPKLVIEMKTPGLTVEEQADKYGDRLWERQPDRCCHMRKVIPLREAMSGTTAWLSGLRREQSPSRSQTNFVNKDETFQSVKICPLIHWTWIDIWDYVKNIICHIIHSMTKAIPVSVVHTAHSKGIQRRGRGQGAGQIRRRQSVACIMLTKMGEFK